MFELQDRGLGKVTVNLLEQILNGVIGVAKQLITGFGGFVAFHGAVHKDWFLSDAVKKIGVRDVSATGQVVHARVIHRGATNPKDVHIVFLHKLIDVFFHVSSNLTISLMYL